MAKVVTFTNFKGGVGKTTISLNIAAGLSKYHKKRVLFLDLDPQMNATAYCMHLERRWKNEYNNKKTIFHAMDQFVKSSYWKKEDYIVKSVFQSGNGLSMIPLLDLIPGSYDLLNFDNILKTIQKKGGKRNDFYGVLEKFIEPLHSDYDFIIIDTAPNLDIKTINALWASNSFCVPTILEPFAEFGLNILLKRISKLKVQKYPDHQKSSFIHLMGIIFTHTESRIGADLQNDYRYNIRSLFNESTAPELGLIPGAEKNIFTNSISYKPVPTRRSIRENLPIYLTPRVPDLVKTEYEKLTEEFIERS